MLTFLKNKLSFILVSKPEYPIYYYHTGLWVVFTSQKTIPQPVTSMQRQRYDTTEV